MLLKNQNIIMLALPRFDDIIESNSYILAKYLAKNNKVYYIDNPFTLKDKFSKYKKVQLAEREKYRENIIQTGIEGLKIMLMPIVASINFIPEGIIYRKILRVNERRIAKSIRKIILQQNIQNYIFINSHNYHYPDITEYLKPLLTLYYCVDPLIRSYDIKHGLISESKIVKFSNIVICTSKRLYEEKKKLNENTYFVPNAADIHHSSKALSESCKVSKIFDDVPKPVLGYFGNIERRIDYSLLKKVIQENLDKSFVFVGPVDENYIPSWMRHQQNVYLKGQVPYSEMPGVLKGFDAALIPFKKDAVSDTIFPLKLFEYLGAGKPVVATDFNEDLINFTEDTVYYCINAEAYSIAITAALEEPPERILDRLKVAKANTWEQRHAQISQILLQYLQME